MSFLIDSLKEKFDFADEEYDYEDFNYVVGNTSGMDVTADIPSEIAQRVGQLAQRGGESMEIKVENPTTFFIDRESLYDVIDGLGLDVSFHSDPNLGYTSSYKTGRGRGFDVIQDYFTKYLENFTSFKKEVEEREDLNFDIQRINPHISTSSLPPLHERMADDVSLDPFGFKISELSREVVRRKSDKGKNIFANEEFLRRMYYTFLLEEVDYDFQYYNLFARYSNKFEDRWEEARRMATNQYYEFKTDPENEEVENLTESLEGKISVIRTGQTQDRGIETEWFDLLKNEDDFEANKIRVVLDEDDQSVDEIEVYQEEASALEALPAERELIPLQQLPQVMYRLRDNPVESLTDLVELENVGDIPPQMQPEIIRDVIEQEGLEDELEKNVENIQRIVSDALDELWKGNGEDKMSIDAKIGALNSHFDVQQMKIQELAYELDDEIESDAEKVLMGKEEYFEKRGPEEDMDVNKHQELLRNLISANFEQQIWMESNMFYRVIPAWMAVSDEEFEGHEGFDAPRMIWETLVERKWGDDYDLDLTDPRAEEGEDPKFLDLLEEKREFRMDVAAASAGAYMWAHFTQVEEDFNMDGNKHISSDHGSYTWIEWMNKYGVGVNMEAMAGSPEEMFKMWRPKDMVAACHAVNLTARKELDEIDESLDGCPVKFTIDMEHVAGFGVDPWEEMELLIEQEKWLAESEYDLQVDKDRPLSKIVRMYHLTKPGWETSQGTGHTHGPFREGDKQLYEWLYNMVDAGFAKNPNEQAAVMYEVGGEQAGTVVQAQLAMDLIELGVEPGELDPSRVDPDSEYEGEKEALMARFFGMDRPNFTREWAKIEEHAFDPLDGLLQAEGFDFTWSGSGAIDQAGNRPNEWKQEEYR